MRIDKYQKNADIYIFIFMRFCNNRIQIVNSSSVSKNFQYMYICIYPQFRKISYVVIPKHCNGTIKKMVINWSVPYNTNKQTYTIILTQKCVHKNVISHSHMYVVPGKYLYMNSTVK